MSLPSTQVASAVNEHERANVVSLGSDTHAAAEGPLGEPSPNFIEYLAQRLQLGADAAEALLGGWLLEYQRVRSPVLARSASSRWR